MRQYDPGRGVSLSSLAYEYPAAWRVPEHSHASDQLIFGISGVMQVAAAQSLWLIPPQLALWVPADTLHEIRMLNRVSMRTLYFRRGLARDRHCAVLHVAPLLRELIVEASRIGELKMRNPHHAALRDVIVEQVNRATPMPTALAMPLDPRASSVARKVLDSLSVRVSLDALCGTCGIGVRTFQRIMRREVGMDFETWRRQARLTKAVELLAGGMTVKSVSLSVGYQQPSTFVQAFRQNFGQTPKAWISAFRGPQDRRYVGMAPSKKRSEDSWTSHP